MIQNDDKTRAIASPHTSCGVGDQMTQVAIKTVTLATPENGLACGFCGQASTVKYSSLRDHLFGAKGEWTLRECSSPHCGLMWLDPMPTSSEVAEAYANYYTHHAAPVVPVRGRLKQLCHELEDQYRRHKYGYLAHRPNRLRDAAGALLHICRTEGCETFPTFVRKGMLLDVGCGAGSYLSAMRDLGWEVKGVEFDESAAREATRRGLDIFHGTLEESRLQANSFDVVVLTQVIEHVPDPLRTIKECVRILKPEGKVFIVTPNSSSFSHHLFGRHWRGLEPPRHLYIFSPASMRHLLNAAGLGRIRITPQVSSSIIRESTLLAVTSGRAYGSAAIASSPLVSLMTMLSASAELLLSRFKPSITDCLGAIAQKCH